MRGEPIGGGQGRDVPTTHEADGDQSTEAKLNYS